MPASNPTPAHHTLYEASVIVEQIIWLSAIHASPRSVNLLDDLLCSIETDAEATELLGLKSLAELDSYRGDVETIISELPHSHHTGFLVQAATPVPMNFYRDGESYSASFGVTRPKWFYTATLDDQFAATLAAWAESVVEQERERFRRKKSKDPASE